MAVKRSAAKQSLVVYGDRGARPRSRERLADVRRAVVGFSSANPGRLQRAFVMDLAFHLAGVLEAFLTLRWLLGDLSPTLVQAIAFETLNRVVIVAFKFVPFRIGVDEALTGAVAPMLAVHPAAGVSLAIVRKVRGSRKILIATIAVPGGL